MPVYTATFLSGSTSGKPVAVVATASPGTTLHTVSSATTNVIEEVYVDLVSQATSDRLITLEAGGTATTNQQVWKVPAHSAVRAQAGNRYQSATAIIIAAFGTATGGVVAQGAVNRFTP